MNRNADRVNQRDHRKRSLQGWARLGSGGFDFTVPADALDAREAEATDDDEDDAFEIEGRYDPDVAPDPAEWLALDLEERRLRRTC